MKTAESEIETMDVRIQAYLMNFEQLPYGVGVIKKDSYLTERKDAFL